MQRSSVQSKNLFIDGLFGREKKLGHLKHGIERYFVVVSLTHSCPVNSFTSTVFQYRDQTRFFMY